VINLDCPSQKYTIEYIAKNYLEPVVNDLKKKKVSKMNFVTHSMGGIVLKVYLANNRLKKLGRIVMIAPPNKGSVLPDIMIDLKIFKIWNGPAGSELGTKENSFPNILGKCSGEIGIIAGNSSLNPIFSYLIPGDNDGKVSVEQTKLAEMRDFVIVEANHTFIISDKEVINQVLTFLSKGCFDKTNNIDKGEKWNK
jgi:hypothetical protein